MVDGNTIVHGERLRHKSIDLEGDGPLAEETWQLQWEPDETRTGISFTADLQAKLDR